MKLRIVSTILWGLAGWAVAGCFAAILGVSPLIGPFVGAVWGAFVLIDPKHVLWGPRGAQGLGRREATPQRVDS
jgi:hypothetical protein